MSQGTVWQSRPGCRSDLEEGGRNCQCRNEDSQIQCPVSECISIYIHLLNHNISVFYACEKKVPQTTILYVCIQSDRNSTTDRKTVCEGYVLWNMDTCSMNKDG